MGQLRGASPYFVPGPPSEVGNPSAGLVSFVLKHAQGRVLDIGGGKGAYAYELHKRGFDVTVAELNRESLAAASAAGLATIDMNDTNWEELRGRYDTVLLLEVLEHIDGYADFLRQAFSCASKKLLLTVPCNDDFKTLFASNLTYNHIAVSDHVNHFTSEDLRQLFATLPCSFQLSQGDHLFPWAFLDLMSNQLRDKPLAKAMVLPLRVLNKLQLFPQSIPTRCYVVAERAA